MRRLKNSVGVARKTIEELRTRMIVRDNSENPYKDLINKYLDAMRLIDLNDVEEYDLHRVKMCKSLFDKSLTRVFDNSFIDTFTIAYTTSQDETKKLRMVHADEELIASRVDLVKAMERRLQFKLDRRNVVITSSTLIGVDVVGKLRACKDVKIAVWDGFLDSPNGVILLMEKVLDRYSASLIVKKAKSETHYDLEIIDMNTSCDIIGRLSMEDVNINKNVLTIASKKTLRYDRDELIRNISRWEKLQHRKRGEDINGKKAKEISTENNKGNNSRRIIKRDRREKNFNINA